MLRQLWLITVLPLVALPTADGANKTPKFGVEKDLQLRVKRIGSGDVRPQGPIQLKIELVNTSRTRSYHVVKPGDGSGVGWREPHVYLTGEARAKDGTWKPLPKRIIARCGLFDPDWRKDVVKLKPGGALALKDWLPAPEHAVEYQRAGGIRIFVHYKYSQGRAAKGKRRAGAPAPGTGRMGATPAFHLVSNPVRLKVIRPLELRLTLRKKRLAAGWNHQLSKILSVSITNRSGKRQTFTPPTASSAQLRLELEGDRGRSPRIDQRTAKSSASVAVPLRSGQTAAVLGKGAKGLDGHWSYPDAGKVRLRAVYTLTRKPREEISSEWVAIEFFKRKAR